MRCERSFAVPFLEHVDPRRHVRIEGPGVSETAWLCERALDPSPRTRQRVTARPAIDIDDRLYQDLMTAPHFLKAAETAETVAR